MKGKAEAMEGPPLFFGCSNHELGHYVWTPSGKRAWGNYSKPLALFLCMHDSRLAPPELKYADDREGKAAVHHYPGFDVLAFWDNSVDGRVASNAMFLIDGNCEPEQVIAAAREAFPDVWARFKFDVTVHSVQTGTWPKVDVVR